MTSKKRLILSYGILALLLAVLFAANLFWGSVSLTPGAVLALSLIHISCKQKSAISIFENRNCAM